MSKETNSIPTGQWQTVERPGYFGKAKDDLVTIWDARYGRGKWRIAWELADGRVLSFEEIFWQVYVAGYVAYFQEHKEEARFLTEKYSFAFDKDEITRGEAFDPHALYGKPGKANQFHHVAINIALELFLGFSFRGARPIQVREGKPGTDPKTWPEGYRFSPGRIPAVRPDLTPNDVEGWWQRGSIEDLYQSAKVIQRLIIPEPPLPITTRWD